MRHQTFAIIALALLLPNDHPDNAKWQVQHSNDGGSSWKVLLGD